MRKKRILLSAVVIAALTFPSIAEEGQKAPMPEAEMAASTE